MASEACSSSTPGLLALAAAVALGSAVTASMAALAMASALSSREQFREEAHRRKAGKPWRGFSAQSELEERLTWGQTLSRWWFRKNTQRSSGDEAQLIIRGALPSDGLLPNSLSYMGEEDADKNNLLSFASNAATQLAAESPTLQRNGQNLNGKPNPFDPSKRNDYISWDDYFMAVAFLSAQRSKDPNRQVGACIVSSDHVILGIGYNGFPRGVHDDDLPWAKASADGDPLKTKYPYVCHAEVNAILNRNLASVSHQRMYVTMFPCNECAKLIIQARILEVVYFVDKGELPQCGPPSHNAQTSSYAASRRLLAMAGVKVWRHQPAQKRIVVEFN